MMSDGPLPPKEAATVEQTQQTLAEKADNPEPPVAVSTIESPVQSQSSGPALESFLHGRKHRYDVNKGYGLVAIINNFTKKEDDLYREGTKQDQERIEKFFRTGEVGRRYIVLPTRTNLDDTAFKPYLRELVDKLEDPTAKINSFFLFIMSHGGADGVLTYYAGKKDEDKEEYVTVDEINKKFKKCIKDCPKVIVVQACRGSNVNKDSKADKLQHPTDCVGNGAGMRFTIPDAADMLIVLSTVKDYVAFRDTESGSLLLYHLFNLLKEAHDKKYYSSHLIKLLTEVQRKVAELGEVSWKQMPCFESTLRKKFYLLPPVLPH